MDVDRIIHDLAMVQVHLEYSEWFEKTTEKERIIDNYGQLAFVYTECVRELAQHKEELTECFEEE